MFVVPDELLNKLKCSVCSKYLSVKPIKIYRNRVIKCGRCSKNNDGGVVSMYDNIAVNGLFPCINRYEGCRELLAYSAVADHETKCLGSHYSCPICCSEFSSYHFVQHYESKHSDAVLEKPEILLTKEKDYEKYYMYRESDIIFILYVRCNLEDECFIANAACLGQPKRTQRIKQYVKCFLGDYINYDKMFLQSKQRDCSIIENNLEYFKIPFSKNTNSVVILKFCFDIYDLINYFISKETRTIGTVTNVEVAGFCSRKIKTSAFSFYPWCSFCENMLTDVYACSCIPCHKYCESCWKILPYCYLLKTANKVNQDPTLTIKYSKHIYDCRFECGIMKDGSELNNHEDFCEKNFYLQNLPSILDFNFHLVDGKSHFISRSNVFSFKDYGFQNGEKIFVTTRDYFKFVLHSSYKDNRFHFWVSHGYLKDKFRVEFKIRDQALREEVIHTNTCTLNNNNDFTVKNVPAFAVFIRKQ